MKNMFNKRETQILSRTEMREKLVHYKDRMRKNQDIIKAE